MNDELFRKVYGRIETTVLLEEAEPGVLSEGWNQFHWGRRTKLAGGGCRTTYCWAGWTCLLAGDELLFETKGDREYAEEVRTTDGRVVWVQERATELLGLNQDQANRLFYADHDLERIRYLAEDFGVDL